MQLTRDGQPVAGRLSYDPARFKVDFFPQRPLDLVATYTATAKTGIRDLAGNSLAAPVSWSFTTADGKWQGARRVDPPTHSAFGIDLAADGDGNTAIVWMAETGVHNYEIWTRSRSAAGEWGEAHLLAAPGHPYVSKPSVRYDGKGNALAVWSELVSFVPDAQWRILAARYTRSEGWLAPVVVESPVYSGVAPSLAMAPSGTAYIAWISSESADLLSRSDVWGARFTSAQGWDSHARLGNFARTVIDGDWVVDPYIAVDQADNAYVAWGIATSLNPIAFAHYQAGSGWKPAVSLGAPPVDDSVSPTGLRLAVSNQGGIMAIWNTLSVFGEEQRYDLWWSFATSATSTWSAPMLLENDDLGHAVYPSLAAGPGGKFHVVWQQYAGEARSAIRHRIFTTGAGWTDAPNVSTSHGERDLNLSPMLVADRNGNLMALWSLQASSPGSDHLGTYSRRYASDAGWQAPTRMSDASSFMGRESALALRPDGSLAGAWIASEPGYFRGPIWVNHLE